MSLRKHPSAALSVMLALAAILALAPGMARARSHHRHGLPYELSYQHNYGPGPEPGTFAFYDGPSTNHCYQSAAAYLGQDHRRHPCF